MGKASPLPRRELSDLLVDGIFPLPAPPDGPAQPVSAQPAPIRADGTPERADSGASRKKVPPTLMQEIWRASASIASDLTGRRVKRRG